MSEAYRTFQMNLTGGELSPGMYSRPDVSKYQSATKEMTNFVIKPQGGARFRGGTFFVGPIYDGNVRNFQLPFEVGPGESYVLDFGNRTLRFITNGGYLLNPARTVETLNVTAGTVAVFNSGSVPHGLTVGERVQLRNYPARLGWNNRLFYVASTPSATTFTLKNQWGVDLSLDTSLSDFGMVAIPEVVIETPYELTDEPFSLNYAQDQDKMILVHRDYPVHVLTRVSPTEWTLEEEDFAITTVAPDNVSAVAEVAENVDVPEVYRYRVSTVAAETGEESLPSVIVEVTDNDLSIDGNRNRISWDAVPGAERYIVYKEDNGVFGFIGSTTGTTFVDQNIVADLSDGPQIERQPFVGEGNYPGVAAFFEQRLWLASTHNQPAGVWASQSTNYRNFRVSSPLRDSDAITFRIRASGVQQIEALVPMNDLMILTRSGEWVARGGDQKGYLSPTNIILRPITRWGTQGVQPVVVGDFLLHAQRGGDAVRDFNEDREIVSTELSLLARHLFRGRRVVSMAYQRKPDSIVWCVMDDGSLLALTYMLEHDIWGWTRVVLGGTDPRVENVTVIEEGDQNVVYLQVRRTVAGAPVRYIERIDNYEATTPEQAHHLDCGLRVVYVAPFGIVRGLDHLEGATVSAVVNGDVIHNLPVVNGAIQLDLYTIFGQVYTPPNEEETPDTVPFPPLSRAPAPPVWMTISVGYRYTGRIRTLDLDVGAVNQIGHMAGRHKTITEVRLRVENTRGLRVSAVADDGTYLPPVEWRQRATEAWNESMALFTGTVRINPSSDWSTNGELLIEQHEPMPATINGILIDWIFGR